MTHRNKKKFDYKKFQPADINITLIELDPEKYTFVKSKANYKEFGPSLIIDDDDFHFMRAGKYMLILDYRWNQIAKENHILKEVTVSVTANAKISLTQTTT